MARRTKSGKWKSRSGGTYTTRRAATRADRRRKVSRTSNKNRRRKNKRGMRGRRRK
jgi:hypothetical protein